MMLPAVLQRTTQTIPGFSNKARNRKLYSQNLVTAGLTSAGKF